LHLYLRTLPSSFIIIFIAPSLHRFHYHLHHCPSSPSWSSSSFITVIFLELVVAVTVSSRCLPRRCFQRVLNGFSLKGSENPNLHHATIFLTVATFCAQDRNQVRCCVN
ncbi:hypothetical protein S245_065642, partial [Arachis hypogaea]